MTLNELIEKTVTRLTAVEAKFGKRPSAVWIHPNALAPGEKLPTDIVGVAVIVPMRWELEALARLMGVPCDDKFWNPQRGYFVMESTGEDDETPTGIPQ